MVEVRTVKMDETENQKAIIKPISEKMDKLIERIREEFHTKYGFKPSIIDTTNLIAEEIERKGFKIN